MIVDTLMNSTDFCTINYIIFEDMGAAIGGTPSAYLLIYGILFIILPIIGLTIARDPLLGLLGATAGHITVLLLGGAGCLPLPVAYLVVGNLVYVFLAGVMWYVYKQYRSGG